jgi:UDP-galactopyranose mutase
MQIESFNVLVVGAGFFGATVAERAARQLGLKVCVIDRRRHIAGNAYSETDPETGVEVHRYGSHIFHTNSETVWRYIQHFGGFNDYQHRVITVAGGRVYSMPINLATMCAAFGKHLTPGEARDRIAAETRGAGKAPANLEDKAIASVGRTLYELVIRGYTEKQWQTDPRSLPAETINRLPVRFDFNDRYFSDRYEGIPRDGYTATVQRMLDHDNISVALGVDYFDIADRVRPDQLVIYTGPIDRFFGYRCGRLGWRTVDFVREVHDTEDFQGNSVVNYADLDVPYTRTHEFKHFHPERRHKLARTTVYREYSRAAGPADEPYYPINTEGDRRLYDVYRTLTLNYRNIVFGGRLGTYKYIDMHQAIGAALKTVDETVAPFFAGSDGASEGAVPLRRAERR